MLYLYTGSDRDTVRANVQKNAERLSKKDKARIVRITDAHASSDLTAAMLGGGMFGGRQVVILEGVLSSEEMAPVLMGSLEALQDSPDHFFILEEKVDAVTRNKVEKYADTSERFDAKKGYEDKTAFSLANALKRHDKKALWVGYLREIDKGTAPEMLLGILFWAAKSMVLASRVGTPERTRGEQLVARLAELPHESRRKGIGLEYALEQFVLAGV